MRRTANPATTGDRVAALALTFGLAAVAGLQIYWTIGGTWAVHAASGGGYDTVTTGLRIQSTVVAVLLVVACLLVLARVGLLTAPLSFDVLWLGAWTLAALLSLAAIVNFAASTSWERLGNGPVALVLALLAIVVAHSGSAHHLAHVPHRAAPSH